MTTNKNIGWNWRQYKDFVYNKSKIRNFDPFPPAFETKYDSSGEGKKPIMAPRKKPKSRKRLINKKCKLKSSKFTKILASFILLFIIIPSFVNNGSDLSETKPEKSDILLPNVSMNLEWNTTVESVEGFLSEDLVIDDDGYIYVTGSFYNASQGDFDIKVIKYNWEGSEIWNRTWGGNLSDYPTSIDHDSLNNIYITGRTENFDNDFNIFVIKYNSSGDFVWNYTQDVNGYESGEGIVIDKEDNIYVAGIVESVIFYVDFELLKFNSSGALIFTQTWGDTDTDWAYDIAIDNEGDIYITGSTHIPDLEKTDLCLIKLNKSGSLNWSSTWGGQYADWGESLVIDELNNIYVAATTNSYGSGWKDIAILKYNHTGGLEWNKTWGGTEIDMAEGIAMDSHNNIYLLGTTKSFGGQDLCILKYNISGELQWEKILQSNTPDMGIEIEIDMFDNNKIYITGAINGEFTLIKYNQLPGEFKLTSNVISSVDPDGNFSLSWGESSDANNYSLYQYDKPITEFNDSLFEVVNGNINRTYTLKNYAEGEYYFIVIAYNSFGNQSSNQLKIVVEYPPEDFFLYENEENPDIDGKMNLTWQISIGAYNYSIYSHNSYIHEINNNGTLVAEGLTNHSYLIKGLTNQDIYYKIISKNLGGTGESNCIKVQVRRAPDEFIIYTTAENPDKKGQYEIIWSKSDFAENYSVYFSTRLITNVLDDNVMILLDGFKPEFDWPTYKFTDARGNGVFYYQVVAFNQYGNYSSASIEVVVQIPNPYREHPDEIEETQNDNLLILPIILLMVFSTSFGLLVYLGKKRGFTRL